MVLKLASGKFKGKTLASSSSARELRPTQAKVREAIINTLTSIFVNQEISFEDLIVLDLFSGTGSMGFEFLSNNAAHVTFIDYDPKCLKLLKDNSNNLKIQDKVSILRGELPGVLKRLKGQKYNLVFCDPPFKISPELYFMCLEVILAQKLVPESGIWVLEYKNHDLADLISSKSACGLDLIKVKDYGDAIVAYAKTK
ncbi:MAG: RsmD family RNA methyltransferase [Candidatus Caenarcaniphilales bacterium]|jgi:16S rRNA (guanine966-N2)-methyltransferase|nr:RsmD family RNA methyltransferase [Candidatus Caenarcaniphilales bacterium]